MAPRVLYVKVLVMFFNDPSTYIKSILHVNDYTASKSLIS